MKALIQRVQFAKVVVDGQTLGEIGPGILTLLAIGPDDTEKELGWMISKILKLRIFEDPQGKMNLSLQDIQGQHLIVSQFTLYGDASKGNRPSFTSAAKPEIAEPLYLKALEMSRAQGVHTGGGKFGSDMKVSLLNDGPVTLMIESP